MGFEFQILQFIQTLRTPILDFLMVAITRLGDHGIFCIFLGLLLLCVPNTRRTGWVVLISLGLGFLIGNVVIKNLTARQRPCWVDESVILLIQNPKDFSFPSGHTMVSFETAVSIFLRYKKWGIATLLIAALVGFSRMYLYVHFPTDVLAGMILGSLIALFANWALGRIWPQVKDKSCKVHNL